MELFIKTYGKFILEGMTVLLLMIFLFGQIKDEKGNRGIFHIIGVNLPREETNITEYEDFAAYRSEGSKGAPTIYYSAPEKLYTGTYQVSDCITAVDDTNIIVPVCVLRMWNPYGVEVDLSEYAGCGELVFEQAGVYTIEVAAMDVGNRRTVCLMQIPINKEEI